MVASRFAAAALVLVVAQLAWGATFWVATDGKDTNAGTESAPFLTIAKGVATAQAGDTVNVKGGLYRITSGVSFPRTGTSSKPIVLQGAAGQEVIIKGSQVVTGWSPVAGTSATWRTGWAYYIGLWHADFLANPNLGGRFQDRARNQLFLNGQIVKEVPTRGAMTAGSYYIDKTAKTVDLWLADGGDPNAHFVEMTRATNLLYTNGHDYIHIKRLKLYHCGNTYQADGALRVNNGSDNCLLEDCTVEWAHASGVSISGNNHVMRRCNMHRCGQYNLHATQLDDTLIDMCDMSHWDHHPNKPAPGADAGPNKITRANNVTINRAYVTDSRDNLIWFDINNRNCTISNCVLDGSTRSIHYEISHAGRIYNNLCINAQRLGDGNAGQGIFISSSSHCKIYNNTVWGNETYGIHQKDELRSYSNSGVDREVRCVSNRTFNNIVADNQRGANTKSYNLPYGTYDPIAYPNPPHRPPLPTLANFNYGTIDYNVSDYNLFWIPANKQFFVSKNNASTLQQWQADTQNDLNSVWGDPKFRNPAGGDFTLLPGSPAINKGVTLSEFTTDLTGRTRTGGYDIGAYEFSGTVTPNPPTVTAVYASDSTWNSSFLGAVGNLGYAIPTGSGVQLKPLPWRALNQLKVVFSKDVNIVASNVTVTGVQTASYPLSLSYDAASRTATITLAQNTGPDKLMLVIKDAVTDTEGNKLDGEWDNPTSTTDPSSDTFPSGNATAGGDFAFRINVLPGDCDRSGLVNSLDASPIRFGLSSGVGDASYSIFADLDGNGIINSLDYTPVRMNLSRGLPAGEPAMPASPAGIAVGGIQQMQ